MSETADSWYILQTKEGPCKIVGADQLAESETWAGKQQWGPFASQQEAITRRVGLIRAGKCKPV